MLITCHICGKIGPASDAFTSTSAAGNNDIIVGERYQIDQVNMNAQAAYS